MLELAQRTDIQQLRTRFSQILGVEIRRADVSLNALRKVRAELLSPNGHDNSRPEFRRLLAGSYEIYDTVLAITSGQENAAQRILTATYDQISNINLPLIIGETEIKLPPLEWEVSQLLMEVTTDNQQEIGTQALELIALYNGHTKPNKADRVKLLKIKFGLLNFKKRANKDGNKKKKAGSEVKRKPECRVKVTDHLATFETKQGLMELDFLDKSFTTHMGTSEEEVYMLGGERLRLMLVLARNSAFTEIDKQKLCRELECTTNQDEYLQHLAGLFRVAFPGKMNIKEDTVKFSGLTPLSWGRPKIEVQTQNQLITLDIAGKTLITPTTLTSLNLNESIVLSELLLTLSPNDCYPDQQVPFDEFTAMFELPASDTTTVLTITNSLKAKLKDHPLIKLKEAQKNKAYYIELK